MPGWRENRFWSFAGDRERRGKRIHFRRPLFLARRYFHQFWHLRPQCFEIGCFRHLPFRQQFENTRRNLSWNEFRA
jgi:hypothetical protein